MGLTGLLPHGVSRWSDSCGARTRNSAGQTDDLGKNVYLANLWDCKEVLFYRLLTEHLEECCPVVYTPTIGQAIERFSHEFRRPRGVHLSMDHPTTWRWRSATTAWVLRMSTSSSPRTRRGFWASATGMSAALRSLAS